ncbi:MAG: ATP-dependent DNA helicase UvrD2 [Actinobacteria bacterium]|nr:ATP-dependent DNA helicase UvrD2 [Actinomycetota bacterium]
MPNIQCAHCGSTHTDVASVRACWQSTGAPSPSTQPAGTSVQGGTGRPAPALGRGVIVSPGQPAPEPWASCPRIRLGGPGSLPEQLEDLVRCHFERQPVVVELQGEWSETSQETFPEPPWSLTPAFTFPGEQLRTVLGNCLDARSGEGLGWALTNRAVRLGATPGGPADVILPDGRPAYCDGGPLRYLAPQPTAKSSAPVLHRVALEHSSLIPFGTNLTNAELAEDQRAAVVHADGTVRIIAPAGSGKTRVLTERARHLLKAWKIPSQALCLVAFNKRAAEQMKDRTGDLQGLQIRSLNALGLAVVSGSGRFGESRTVETIDERSVRSILDSLVKLGRRANADPAAAWLEAFSLIRLGLRAPAEVEADFAGDVQGLPEIFDSYRRALAVRGVVDFDEQIYRAIEILLSDPSARYRARRSCGIMLVDEFQDLTPAHLLLIRLLAGPSGTVFGVGDDDQTIYGYAGATPDWLINYTQFFPGSGSHALSVNYRCPREVVNAARVLLTHNRRRVDKHITSPPAAAASASSLQVRQSDDPVSSTVDTALTLLKRGAEPTDLAVLTRVNNSLAPVQLLLASEGVPVNQAVGAGFLERTGVRAALGWLRIAAGPSRLNAKDIALTARRPPRALSPKVIEWMAEQRTTSVLRSLADRLSDRDSVKVHSFTDDIEMLASVAAGASTDQVLRALRDRVGLAEAMQALDGQRRRLDRSPQTDDLDILIAVGKLHTRAEDFERWLREGLSAPGDPHGVTLASIHAVKGREWAHVIVHDATAGLLPHRLATDREEERRVFHVALTRGCKSVTVTAGSPPSIFLEEMKVEWVQPAVREPAEIEGATTRPASQTATATPTAEAAAAADLLRRWRLERARSTGKPAYTIMHDKTLEEIAGSGCSTLDDLARIRGIGPAKLQSFGDEILAVLEEAAAP